MKINNLFAVPMHDIDLNAVMQECLREGEYRIVVTPNVDHMCRIYTGKTQSAYYLEADFCVCDSKVLQILSFLLLRPIKHVVRGSDLTLRLLQAIPKGHKVFILGDHESQAALVSDLFKLENISIYVPPWGFSSNEQQIRKCVKEIKSANPDVILLAVGSPAQEAIAHLLRTELDAGVSLCIGNSVNFCTGRIPRSPRWMSLTGLEWLHRIWSEPRRMIRRYLGNVLLLWYLFRSKLVPGNRVIR